jgi:nucleotide-binding universal stress UspA family protein
MFSNILVPLDWTAESTIALPLARTVAWATGGSITLLRVVRPHDAAGLKQASTELERLSAESMETGPRVESAVAEAGNVAHEILAQIQRRHVDLVIMRTHGRAGLNRAVLGSVTQDVLANARVPVMVLRPGCRRITHIGKLLVPIDGSPGGTLALSTAVQLSRTTGASLKLLQVAAPATTAMYPGEGYAGMSYYDPAWDEEALASARGYVDGMVARVRATNVDVEGEACQEPVVVNAIIRAAEAEPVDLIVMSTRALTGPARVLLGSTADAVVRSAHCPVLLLHRGSEAEKEPAEFAPEPFVQAAAPLACAHAVTV